LSNQQVKVCSFLFFGNNLSQVGRSAGYLNKSNKPSLLLKVDQGYLHRNGSIWRCPFGDDYLAPAIWRWAVFGASAYLLDYYYTHVVVSKTVFSFCSDVFQEGNCFFQGNKRCAFVL